MKNLEQIIKNAFEDKEKINKDTNGEVRDAVEYTLNQLDNGSIRVCQKINGEWIVNQWIKKAILLSFRLSDNEIIKASKECLDFRTRDLSLFLKDVNEGKI